MAQIAKRSRPKPKAAKKASKSAAVKPMRLSDGTGALTPQSCERYRAEFDTDPKASLAMNAVTANPVGKVALNRRVASMIDNSFSVQLPENKATAQNSSGRCWMFAALNTFRPVAIKKMNLGEEFELSQNFTMFWDKLEKANYFLENILATLDEPVGSRLLDWLLTAPVQDGGQWHMFTNLVGKYGVVPKSVMPETESSSNTRALNSLVTGKLREFACKLRARAESGGGSRSSEYPNGERMESLRTVKERMVSQIYRMLSVHLGQPPSSFHWQWRDKDKAFHREGGITPKQFYDRYVGVDLADYVCLIHDPRPGHPTDRAYTIQYLGNVVGGEPVLYLNVSLETMKKAALAQLQEGEPVWFGCDVGKFMDRDLGVMDPELFDYAPLYGDAGEEKPREDFPGLSKPQRLMYGQSLMTHAMVFTGVDLDERRKPRKWRVENSWSDKPGDKGFFQMSDRWFDEFNYEVVVRRRHVPKASLAGLSKPVIALPPWDPMGSLA